MQHPFIGDLSDKTLDELQTTINELTKKLSYAYRINHMTMINQLQMAMDSYKTEASKRLDELYKKQNIQNQINISKT